MLASIFNGTDKQIRFRRCVQSQTRQKTIGHQVAKGRQHAILMSDSQRKTKRNERKEKDRQVVASDGAKVSSFCGYCDRRYPMTLTGSCFFHAHTVRVLSLADSQHLHLSPLLFSLSLSSRLPTPSKREILSPLKLKKKHMHK